MVQALISLGYKSVSVFSGSGAAYRYLLVDTNRFAKWLDHFGPRWVGPNR